MRYMFANSNFNKNISEWNISNISDMSYMFYNLKFNKDISNWFLKLNKNCKLRYFIKNNNININSYNDFKQYHRKMILNKL